MKENFEIAEKLEKIEASALENMDEATPLELDEVERENVQLVEEPVMEMSSCSCMSCCGSNYSRNGSCSCMSSCGSNYNKG